MKANPNDYKGFELEKALLRMVNSYSLWKKGKKFPRDNININDEEVIKHLNQEIHWSKGDKIPLIFIKDFPNEKGYFSLWELSINDDLHSKKILPIFITDEMIFRPIFMSRLE